MKLREYLLKEITDSVAYWLSPKGEVVDVGGTHIDVIINNPEKFGLTSKYIKDLHDKYGEKLSQEGKAREEIIIRVVKDGWIRVRRYRNQGYSINVSRITKKVKDILFDWATKLTSSGILGSKEKDIYMPLNIISFLDNSSKTLTLKNVLSGMLYEGTEEFDENNKIILCENIREVQ